MKVVDVAEMEAPKKRAPHPRVKGDPTKKLSLESGAPPQSEPLPQPEPLTHPEPLPLPPPLKEAPVSTWRVPMPATMGFAEDQKFRGITAAMDRVLDSLHRDGWSLQKLYEQPLAVLPLPEGKFPPGRVYMMTDSVAVVVNKQTGLVITSLPVTAALKTLNQFTPKVLEGDEWAMSKWEEFLTAADEDDIDLSPRWYKQSWFDKTGAIWTVRRVHDGVKIYKDGDQVHLVQDDVEAEDLGLHPITVEMVAYVLEIEQPQD